MSINRGMDKPDVVYRHKGVLFSHKKEWRTDTYYNMNDLWKQDATRKKSITEKHVLYEWVYAYEMSGRGQFPETESRMVVSKGWGEMGIGGDC